MTQTFKQFLLERRSTKMDLQKAKAWMEAHAMDYLNGDLYLYRGIKDDIADITFADTHVGEPRKSIGGMANFYTLWMSYNPEWKDKPRRERSFITSSSAPGARSWGLLHLVVPASSAKVGAVDADDIWNVVLHTGKYGDFRLARFTTMTRNIFKSFDMAIPTDYSELASSLKQITLDKLLEPEEGNPKEHHFDTNVTELMQKHGVKNMFEMWSIVFDPKNFKFMTPGNLSLFNNTDGEFWIDGQALYIPLTMKMKPEDAKDLMTWARTHSKKLAGVLKDYWNYNDNI